MGPTLDVPGSVQECNWLQGLEGGLDTSHAPILHRLLREAINTVRAGGTPAGVAPSYYDLYCALQVLPRDADWRQILAPDIAPEKILQTV